MAEAVGQTGRFNSSRGRAAPLSTSTALKWTGSHVAAGMVCWLGYLSVCRPLAIVRTVTLLSGMRRRRRRRLRLYNLVMPTEARDEIVENDDK